MTARLACWSNRFLSKAGRKVLVSAVLQAMVLFWAWVCMLPKTVIQSVNTLCARFLWKGSCDKKGGHLVSWEKVCRDKKEGGLGLRNIELMNYAMVINQMWGKKEGNNSAWTDRMDKYWSKGKHWWEDEVKADNSWVLKRLMQCKKIGLSCVTITNDSASWNGQGEGFGAKDTYNTLIEHTALVDWHKLVWNDFNAPRDSFNAWLAVQDKLMTEDRMSKWGFPRTRTCVLCKVMDESRDHLFFDCRFTRVVWTEVMRYLKVLQHPSCWELLIPWFKGMPQKRLKTKLIAAAITRAMNGILKARNVKIFRAEETIIARLVQDTIWYLKMKIGAIKKEACDKEDTDWLIDMRFID